jgi:alkanesulfonate monooxygenase SsuD/methylene tetrahydromethanopterin reductase-like flavin-dependent oxidoreductase (luciferase family)
MVAMTSNRPLKVGAFLPHLEGAYEDGTAGWRELRDMARAAEDVGFDSVWVADHFLYRFPGIEAFGSWECWSMVTALAAATTRVEIGTLVSVTPWRSPGLLAKIIDTAEEISGGRVIVGLGAGSHDAEFEAFGFGSWDTRISRFEEELTILSSLLRTGHVDHRGRYHTLRDCELRPRGPRPEGPPIMVGAVGDRMLRAAVAHADEWNIPWRHSLDEVVAETARGAAACADAGRDPATLRRSVCMQIDLPRPAGSSRSDVMNQSRAGALTGTPEELAAHLRSYADAGVSHAQLWIDPATPDALTSFGATLAALDAG